MKRSKHSLGHYRLASLNQGELMPMMCLEVLPGDSIRHQVGALIRVAPLAAPVMHPVDVHVHSWFVPARILWDGFENFMTNKDNLLSTVPTLNIGSGDNVLTKRLAQSFGIGSAFSTTITLNSLAFRAYNKIYNEFYRDQDLTPAIPERTGDTGDLAADYLVRKVSWEKDYFTTCRPFPQQGAGDEVVPITPTAAMAPIVGLGRQGGAAGTSNVTVHETNKAGTTVYPSAKATYDTVAGAGGWMRLSDSLVGGTFKPDVWADLTGVSLGGMRIEDWRRSMALQRIREHRNRYGSRYRDMLAFLGVRSSDARLQRPEYLGGGKQTIAFSEVLSTADTTTAELGAYAGHGIAAVRTRPYKRFFEEHGYVITLMFARPRTMYVNAVPRHFLRRKYNEYWQKEMEVIGEQSVTNFEVYGDSATPSTVFGYIQRFDEYRHMESSVSGEFRNTLDYWHMGRKFATQPVLNASFVEADPTTRIYQSAVTDQLYTMCNHRLIARRLVSKKGRA